jgi:FAD/FMN-containing dehydrogenase
MDQPASDKVEAFVSEFKGEALRAGDPEYYSSRAIWNGAIDRKPAVIARCADVHQVASAVRFARDSDLEISVRGGATTTPGPRSATAASWSISAR